MRLPFTQRDYVRALKSIEEGLTGRQRAVLEAIGDLSLIQGFTVKEAAHYAEMTSGSFLITLGHINGKIAPFLGCSIPPEINGRRVWYGLIIEPVTEVALLPRSGETFRVRKSFAEALKQFDFLPL